MTEINSREQMILNIFENVLPSYYNTDKIRTSQVQMAIDVAAFLEPRQTEKRVLAVEAPVGTGKSLGALVPALVECAMDQIFSPKRVVYATATINLQGQLMNGEVPLLKELDLLDTALLAKGKAHYYCKVEKQRAQLKNEQLSEKLDLFFRRARTGQRDEFESTLGEIKESDWKKVSLNASKRACERCPFFRSCPTAQHRNQFLSKENQLIITNQEQLIRSALNRLQETPTPPVIPVDPGIMIIDEAHDFIENFLSRMEDAISIRDLKAIGNKERFPGKLAKRFKSNVTDLERFFHRAAETCESLQGRYPLDPYVRKLQQIERDLSSAFEILVLRNLETDSTLYDRADDYVDEIERVIISIQHLLDNKGFVSWVSYEDNSMVNIPVNFPTEFKRLMSFLASRNKVILMSGTLTTNGDFTSFLNQWRLPRQLVELKMMPQSFQYDKQALVYIPESVHDPRNPGIEWIEDQLKHYQKLLNLTDGRTLLLSTSKQHMQGVAEPLKDICDAIGVSLLRQDEGGVEQLTKQFKEDERSVLLGSGSFFSGFSVAGTSLVSVIFSRLPFPVPDDPYLKLIGEGLEDVFKEQVLLPHMMTKLSQGSGRLIRDISDYGLITILDPRVFNSDYSETIQRDFKKKGYRITRSFEEVEEFYAQKLALGSQATYPPYATNQIVVPESLKLISPKAVKRASSEVVKGRKNHKITEDQHKFALEVCKKNDKTLSKKPKTGEDLYKFLVDIYYQRYSSISPVKDNFPYINDDQKNSLATYYGSGQQQHQLRKCTHEAFGCTGNCSEQFQKSLRAKINQCGGALEEIYPSKDFCWLTVTPHNQADEIMEKLAASREPVEKI
ncbi:hypothetical protein ABE82_26430 (plasmid) [Paenibacillus peoriae]|uniref:ATP-dependent DNA helicase n=1 Tax=Paenibacillus peoriae TaxID=59893 RepID=UPI00071F8B56|nr:ATP-dependent DNA helicase [Paenibacillus peoriae]ALS09954.1 hypothetical protein ABE82_26430 [Paenibacillus peoriae]